VSVRASRHASTATSRHSLPKTPTGILGLDAVLDGGLPYGRPTLLTGSAGCGKTLFATKFLVNGTTVGEGGVLMSFDESAEDIAVNTSSLGMDVARLVAKKKLFIDFVEIGEGTLLESGDYDLEGLFIRLEMAIKEVDARRVVLDGIDNLFAGLTNTAVLRSEVRRLLQWLKARRLTSIVTAEKGVATLTRSGLEEYLTDCVIVLNHNVEGAISTRRLRVVKYRGSTHGTNEYPFLIDRDGISVLPVTSMGLEHQASAQRVSSGIPSLDEMLGGKGFYRGSSILLSGTAGSGKSSVAAHFVDAACRRGERALYFAFEESASQICRNMASIGIDLGRWFRSGLLQIRSMRPTAFGLEMHLVAMHRAMEEHPPQVMVIDPISSLVVAGAAPEVRSMLLRLFDGAKHDQITTMGTSLTGEDEESGMADSSVSSVMDVWLQVRGVEANGERNRLLSVLKARGIAHSNQMREFLITPEGVRLVDVYLGAGQVLTGSARVVQQAQEQAAAMAESAEQERRRQEMVDKVRELRERIAAMNAEMARADAEAGRLAQAAETRRRESAAAERAIARSRHATTGRPSKASSSRRAAPSGPAPPRPAAGGNGR
jgi:circadian clock protein KaiC